MFVAALQVYNAVSNILDTLCNDELNKLSWNSYNLVLMGNCERGLLWNRSTLGPKLQVDSAAIPVNKTLEYLTNIKSVDQCQAKTFVNEPPLTWNEFTIQIL